MKIAVQQHAPTGEVYDRRALDALLGKAAPFRFGDLDLGEAVLVRAEIEDGGTRANLLFDLPPGLDLGIGHLGPMSIGFTPPKVQP